MFHHGPLLYPSMHKMRKGTNNKDYASECSGAICERGSVKLLQALHMEVMVEKQVEKAGVHKQKTEDYPGCKINTHKSDT